MHIIGIAGMGMVMGIRIMVTARVGHFPGTLDGVAIGVVTGEVTILLTMVVITLLTGAVDIILLIIVIIPVMVVDITHQIPTVTLMGKEGQRVLMLPEMMEEDQHLVSLLTARPEEIKVRM